ncbi:hypothetical protein SKAU_G00117690 [Synaphobranchus kaupii]|uniref:Uncharacterized protein n=1 Tax=Synaphobranchus kaupii TaxID=118154 RepID=A0A9Q1FN36_SYNKA|nr:hypothetical protein SKAU_G00117690 [Synaphobranchus kaupii]
MKTRAGDRILEPPTPVYDHASYLTSLPLNMLITVPTQSQGSPDNVGTPSGVEDTTVKALIGARWFATVTE